MNKQKIKEELRREASKRNPWYSSLSKNAYAYAEIYRSNPYLWFENMNHKRTFMLFVAEAI